MSCSMTTSHYYRISQMLKHHFHSINPNHTLLLILMKIWCKKITCLWIPILILKSTSWWKTGHFLNLFLSSRRNSNSPLPPSQKSTWIHSQTNKRNSSSMQWTMLHLNTTHRPLTNTTILITTEFPVLYRISMSKVRLIKLHLEILIKKQNLTIKN